MLTEKKQRPAMRNAKVEGLAGVGSPVWSTGSDVVFADVDVPDTLYRMQQRWWNDVEVVGEGWRGFACWQGGKDKQKPSSNGAVVSSKKGECGTKGVLMEVDVELCVCFGVQAAWRSANNARRTRRERGWGVEPMKNAYCRLTTHLPHSSNHAQEQADKQARYVQCERGVRRSQSELAEGFGVARIEGRAQVKAGTPSVVVARPSRRATCELAGVSLGLAVPGRA